MGSFSLDRARATQDSPIVAAQRAYMAAQSSGQGEGAFAAAKQAWIGAVTATAQRLGAGQPDQLQPGDRNLRLVATHLQQQYRLTDPVTAYALAHEALATIGAGQAQQPTQPTQPTGE